MRQNFLFLTGIFPVYRAVLAPQRHSKHFLNELNYVKPPENYKSFIQKYMDVIRQRTTHDNLKSIFENYDKAEA